MPDENTGDSPPFPVEYAAPEPRSPAPSGDDSSGSANPTQISFSASLQRSVKSEFFCPLPPPEVLSQYRSFIPDVAERFLAMVTEESQHRRGNEDLQVQADIEDQKAQRAETQRGQYCALAIGCVAIAGGLLAGILGAQLTGTFIGTGGVVALVTAFLRRPLPEKKQSRTK